MLLLFQEMTAAMNPPTMNLMEKELALVSIVVEVDMVL